MTTNLDTAITPAHIQALITESIGNRHSGDTKEAARSLGVLPQRAAHAKMAEIVEKHQIRLP